MSLIAKNLTQIWDQLRAKKPQLPQFLEAVRIVAEALIRGVLDRLNSQLNLNPDDIAVGCDTGKDQFPGHIETLGKFKLLSEFVFVLDGDARSVEPAMAKAAARYNAFVQPLYLPGNAPPEDWIYRALEGKAAHFGAELGAPNLAGLLQNLRQQFDSATDKPTNIMKSRYTILAESLQRTPEEIARIVGRTESDRGELKVFADELTDAITNWRSRSVA